ncbi:mRNA turnover and ribosome assembly protein [Umbelopsis sp. WA50703]
MPKSKRSKVVSLTKTEKKGRGGKDSLFEEVRECVDKYTYLWVFSVENMRNTFLKEVRSDFKDSRFFLGKNKVMAKALGTTVEDEYKENLRNVSKLLTGDVGVLFTDRPVDEVKQYFDDYRQADYARSGVAATETVTIPEGPVMRGPDKMPHNMEQHIRSLGMPTTLQNGVITLSSPYEICRLGQTLTTNQAHLLKLFYHQLAEFRVKLLCYYSEGEVHNLDTAESMHTD